MRGGWRAALVVACLMVSPLGLTVAILGLTTAGVEEAGGFPPAACAAVAVDTEGLDSWMRDRVPGSPLVGMGQVFVTQAGRVGLDPRVLVAIAFHESALGTLGSGADRHNPFGLGPGIRYTSWERSITVAADTLANGYIGEGRTTLAAIAAKWAPVGAANDPSGLNSHWVRGVGAAYAELGGDPAGSVLVGADSAEVCGLGPLLAGGSVPLPMRVAPQVIGTPNAPGSTHDPHVSPDNWQSDNAIDFAMPEGTPLTAVCSGGIGPQFGTLDPSPASRFGGMRLTIVCGDGPSWYYAHLATIAPALAPGVRVRVGQPIGTSGVANTVAHLHIAVDGGDPMVLFGLQRGGG